MTYLHSFAFLTKWKQYFRMKPKRKDAEFRVEQKCHQWFFTQSCKISSYLRKTSAVRQLRTARRRRGGVAAAAPGRDVTV